MIFFINFRILPMSCHLLFVVYKMFFCLGLYLKEMINLFVNIFKPIYYRVEVYFSILMELKNCHTKIQRIYFHNLYYFLKVMVICFDKLNEMSSYCSCALTTYKRYLFF